jgi:hypothetical protein
MGTQRVQMKGILPWLVPWARRAGTRDFYPDFAALVSPVQNIFPNHALFQFMCPHHKQPSQDSRAGPPVSKCLSPLGTQNKKFPLSHILYILNITLASFSLYAVTRGAYILRYDHCH